MNSEEPSNSLPLPRLILRVGGLGNRKFGRDNGLDEDPPGLSAAAQSACDRVFAEIERVLADILEEDRPENCRHAPPDPATLPWWKTHGLGCLFGKIDRWECRRRAGSCASVFSVEHPKLILLTGGAEGSDEILRDTALGRRSPGMEYAHLRIVPDDPALVSDGLGIGTIPGRRKDLEEKLERDGVLPRAEAAIRADIVRRRAHGYRAQSEAVRHHSDVLLAVWDPDTEGKAGGTSESVELALRERIPVIAIRLRGPETAEIAVLRSLDDLRKPARRDGADEWKEELSGVLGRILRFPDPKPDAATHGEPSATTYHARAVFTAFREGGPLKPIWLARFWKGFDRLTSDRAGLRKSADEPMRLRDMFATWLGIDCPEAVPAPRAARSEPADFTLWYGRVKDRAASSGFSGIYGDAHRGGIIASYLFAAVAVMLAVVGAILHAKHFPTAFLAVVAVAEVLAIGLMFALSTCARIEDWHEAYTDGRILAEALRMMEFLGPLGVHTPLPKLPLYLQGDAATPSPEATWSVWYFRALVRMAPLRLDVSDRFDLAAARVRLTGEWLDGQVRHHRANAAKQLRLKEDIEWFSGVMFAIVGVGALLHLLDVLGETHFIPDLAMVICVGGPALIAALHGFSSQIEIERLRQRSSSMVKLLEERAKVLQALDLEREPDNAEAVWGLTTEALTTAALMMDETASWSMLYKHTDIHAG